MSVASKDRREYELEEDARDVRGNRQRSSQWPPVGMSETSRFALALRGRKTIYDAIQVRQLEAKVTREKNEVF